MRSVETNVPDNVLAADNVSIQGQLNTRVADVADVVVVTTCTVALRNIQPEEQVGGLLGVEVEATGETTLPQAPFQTGVEVRGGLPSDVLVTQAVERRNDAGA